MDTRGLKVGDMVEVDSLFGVVLAVDVQLEVVESLNSDEVPLTTSLLGVC